MGKKYFVNTSDTAQSHWSWKFLLQRPEDMKPLDIEVFTRQTHVKLIQ